MDDPVSTQIWGLLTSHGKLDRDRGVVQLQELCSSKSPEAEKAIKILTEILKDFKISDPRLPWETRLGFLLGSKCLLSASGTIAPDFSASVMSKAITLLTDNEVRVRLAAGEVLGCMCHWKGADIYDECKGIVLELIRSNMERERHDSDENSKVLITSGKAKIFHETAGWRNLETSMKCLQHIVEGCGRAFSAKLRQDPEIIHLIFTATQHTNRFVRETGYYTLSSIISSCTGRSVEGCGEEDQVIYTKFRHQIAEKLATGMADNWSQVRLAATTASRHFLTRVPDNLEKHEIHKLLLPCLCLNRYYLAEGVRIYSQETWKMVTVDEPGGGHQTVVNHLESVVNYYVKCTKADNHAVREAACQCIAELASKISKSNLSRYVDSLLNTLVECFNDDSWPVRDMACVASGKFVLSYPQESERCRKELEKLFYENLEDSIPSVRQGAALSLGNLVRAYPEEEEMIEQMFSKINENLKEIKNQPSSDVPEATETSSGLGQYGVIKRARDNDIDLHENRVMYSCGSLAPKMSKTGASGGCSDCKFKRRSEIWEKADGAVHLISNLSDIEKLADKIKQSLFHVAESCRSRHYVSHYFFLETVLKNLPVIAGNIGKRTFKSMFLEEFFDAMFYAVNSRADNALAAAAGSKCVAELSHLVGPSIFRGRVEQYNPRYLSALEIALEENRALEGGPGFFPISDAIPGSDPIPMELDRQPSLGGTPPPTPN